METRARSALLRRVKTSWYWRSKGLRKVTHHPWLEWQLGKIAERDRPLLEESRLRFAADYASDPEPLVSVTIPTYNRGELLVNRTLPSVLGQTYRNLEIVVVGDCCTDGTSDLIRQIDDPRVRFVNLAQRGAYPKHPRYRWMVAGTVPNNAAREMAKGAWISYLDDDDVFTPDHIEVLLSHARERDLELVSGRVLAEVSPGQWKEHGGPTFPTGCRPFFVQSVPHSGVFYRQYLRLFKYDMNAWRYRVPGDNWLWQRMARAGVRAACVETVVCASPLRPGETMLTELALFNTGW